MCGSVCEKRLSASPQAMVTSDSSADISLRFSGFASETGEFSSDTRKARSSFSEFSRGTRHTHPDRRRSETPGLLSPSSPPRRCGVVALASGRPVPNRANVSLHERPPGVPPSWRTARSVVALASSRPMRRRPAPPPGRWRGRRVAGDGMQAAVELPVGCAFCHVIESGALRRTPKKTRVTQSRRGRGRGARGPAASADVPL
jgi:hypothetical protein